MSLALPDNPVDAVVLLFSERGRRRHEEGLTETEHAVQTAGLAEEAGAGPELVVAALLHDIGQLVLDQPRSGERNQRHEAVGARLLNRWFGSAVADPVALHVRAKRYLVAVDPGYAEGLSPASKRSLVVQGGALSPVEAEAFALLPGSEDAVRLRRWVDQAKVPGLDLPAFLEYRPLLQHLAGRRADSESST